MIYNQTKKTAISREYKKCRSQLSKTIGLMFRLRPSSLVFFFKNEKLVPLHMIFVLFPIDILYLDSKKKVVELKKSFRPFTFHKPTKKSKYVVELPAGTIGSTRTSVGDKIRF